MKARYKSSKRSNQHCCICSKIVSVQLYREEVRYLNMREVVERRREIMKIIDGDTFFPLKSWPKDMKLIFWKKPMKDKETFKLVLFLIGNGCSPDLIRRWIVAQYSRTGQLHGGRQKRGQCGPKAELVILFRHRLQPTALLEWTAKKILTTTHDQLG